MTRTYQERWDQHEVHASVITWFFVAVDRHDKGKVERMKPALILDGVPQRLVVSIAGIELSLAVREPAPRVLDKVRDESARNQSCGLGVWCS